MAESLLTIPVITAIESWEVDNQDYFVHHIREEAHWQWFHLWDDELRADLEEGDDPVPFDSDGFGLMNASTLPKWFRQFCATLCSLFELAKAYDVTREVASLNRLAILMNRLDAFITIWGIPDKNIIRHSDSFNGHLMQYLRESYQPKMFLSPGDGPRDPQLDVPQLPTG
jgi:hypothetical protein